MYLLKRIGANLVDALLCIAATLFTSWILVHLNVEDGDFEVVFAIWTGLIGGILLPITLFSKTVGERIFSVKCSQLKGRSLRVSLMLKYSVLYGLATSILITLSFFTDDLLAYFTIFSFSKFFIFRVISAVLVSNAVFFLLSLGHASLFDKIFGLHYGGAFSAKWYVSRLAAGYFFVLTMIVGIVVDWKFHNVFPSKQGLDLANSTQEVKFPKEEFQNYVVNSRIFHRLVLTDKLVTTSDMNSFLQDKYLLQRQIEAQINDEVALDPKKRFELCKRLLEYCYGILSLQETTRQVKQTKVELVHMRYFTPFICMASYYNYYFDDTAGRYGFYGGYNWDNLDSYYLQTMKNFSASTASFVSQVTSITFDSATYYIKHSDTAQWFGRLPFWARTKWLTKEIGPLIDHRIMTMRPIPFENVKPMNLFRCGAPYASFEIFGAPFYDRMELGAITIRNGLGIRSVR